MWVKNVARSRAPIYIPSDEAFGVIVTRSRASEDVQPPPPPPPTPASTVRFFADEMPRTPLSVLKKPLDSAAPPPKMSERRRPPIFRPKSRTDSNRPDTAPSSDEDHPPRIADLRARLADESALYRRRLDTYRQSQADQAALVGRLQAKILQYKQRCGALEAQLEPRSVPPPPSTALEMAQAHLRSAREERIPDLEAALRRLDEERRRSDQLLAANAELRDTNETLTADLQKLSADWEALREEMVAKEDEWKEEELAFNEYYSTEHGRLLNLWRDVVGMKRHFMEVQSATERDLVRIRDEVGTVGRDVQSACCRMDTNLYTDSILGGKAKAVHEREYAELQQELEKTKEQQAKSLAELSDRDARIQSLLKDAHTLEERCADAEVGVAQVLKMQEEIDLLQNALRDIAHALIQDAEVKDLESHLHLSGVGLVPQKSPKRSLLSRSIIAAPAAFAESTISAVQAALHKYQSLIHELQVKLQSNKEQLLLIRKQYDQSDTNVSTLESRVGELVAQLDASRTHCSQLGQDRDTLQKTIDALRAEKGHVERQRADLSLMLDALNADFDKLQKHDHRTQKDVEALLEEKLFQQAEIDRLHQEANLREISLRGEEERCSRIREELLTVREELNKLYLAHDMLEQGRVESDNLIANLERTKSEYELELDKILSERGSVHDSLLKTETQAANLEAAKKTLTETVKRLEEEKAALLHQSNDRQSDGQSLRKELLHAEQQRLDLEAEKTSLSERCKFHEIEKTKIEIELGQASRERGELSAQLSALHRKREALGEELARARQRLEQAAETNARLNRNLEELVKECEERQVLIDGGEKEAQRVQEQLASVRGEKEALEAVLFDCQTSLEGSEGRRAQLEAEREELLLKQEQLRAQLDKVGKELERSEKRALETKNSLTNAAGSKEIEFRQIIDKLRETGEDSVRKLSEERDRIKVSLEKRLQQSLQQLAGEKDGEIGQLVERIEALQNHCENLCQQHEELLLRAENDKQQALLIAHHDQQALHERFECVRRELDTEKESFERLKREANSKFDKDRISINQLKEELNRKKVLLEEAKVKGEEERSRLEQAIVEVKGERDLIQNEVENLRVQLRLCEDKAEGYCGQLHDTLRKLKEAENNTEALRKEITDVRRLLGDSTFEKEKYHNTNKELRDHVKKIEGEKREQQRQIEETYQRLTSLEDVKLSVENDKTRLVNQIRELEKEQLQAEHKTATIFDELQRCQAANSQQQGEEKELQARLLNEVEERERAHLEAHQLKKTMAELERNLEQTRQDLSKTRSHSGHLEEQWHVREQDLLVHLEDARSREKRLEDQKHNFEVCLVDATQQIQELKAKLGGAEGRLRALEAQLAQLEGGKRDVEQKLFSVVSTLRRIAGVQLDGSVSLPYRLLSPSRRWSPARGHEDGREGAIDVDPEAVRKGVRNLMQQVAQIERERDDYKAQTNAARKQLQESHDTQTKGDSKLTKVLQNLRHCQEEKGSLEAKLSQKSVELTSQSAALQKKAEENQQMRDKIVSLELSVSSGNEEKLQYEDKIDKMKMALSRFEVEKRSLQEELSRIENRSTKLELQRLSTEGDLQRLQMMMQEKDANILKLQEKCEHQNRTLASLEERCISLKSTIDQLNLSLEKAASSENELRSEIQTLQRNLLDSTSSSQSGMERLKQLQKALANSENDRRIIAERFETTQQNLAEMRRNNQVLQDQVTRLNADLANNEVQRAGLESQLRLAQWPADAALGAHEEGELHRRLAACQRERGELRARADALAHRNRQLEADKRGAERSLAKGEARVEKYQSDGGVNELERYTQENGELRVKIGRLEAELGEREGEVARLRGQRPGLDAKFDRAEVERYRAAQLQAERLLEAREQSHRQQVARLENQISLLKDQLNQEIKRRQQYVLRSTKAGREMQQLRQALGDSLRTVSQDPSLDALLLEHEARKLDNTLSNTAISLPPALGLPSSSYRRATTPQPK